MTTDAYLGGSRVQTESGRYKATSLVTACLHSSTRYKPAF
jgi:hypothetical protein